MGIGLFENPYIVFALAGIIFLYLISKSKFPSFAKLCLNIAIVHHFFLHGIMQFFVTQKFPELADTINAVTFGLGLGTTLLVTVGLYFTVLFFTKRRK